MSVLSMFFLGLFYLCLLFFVCLFFVLFFKLVLSFIKNIFAPQPTINRIPPKKAMHKRKPKTHRSIEINPEEIDRIYVKKIS